MQMQHVFCLHTQQGMELRPRCCTGTVMTLGTRHNFQCKMNDAMRMVCCNKGNVALPPPRTWMNHTNKCSTIIISIDRELINIMIK
jgi:hypothetical protein